MRESYEHFVRFCGLECVSLPTFWPDSLGADNKD